MEFNSYVISDTKTALSLPLTCAQYSKNNSFMCFLNRLKISRKGFTLAETLITLTIIGVVAALTIPTLVSEYQKHQYVVGLKKAYSTLKNALQMAPITAGCSAGDYSCVSSTRTTSEFINLLSKHYKTKLVDLDGTSEACQSIAGNWACFVTEDGIRISSFGEHGEDIGVDVNGMKGPNIWGRDRFAFRYAGESSSTGILEGTLMPVGSKIYNEYFSITNSTECVPVSGTIGVSKYCTGRVLENGSMDY